jgi:hypothetical protein
MAEIWGSFVPRATGHIWACNRIAQLADRGLPPPRDHNYYYYYYYVAGQKQPHQR